MSVESTNTPSGASNELYSKNKDINKQELAVTDISEQNPEIDLTGERDGDNTITDVSFKINNTTAIRDFGSVRIGATLIGQPQIDSPDAKAQIKLDIATVKNALKARGAITAETYIQLKKDAVEKKKAGKEEIEEDKAQDEQGK